MPIIYAYSCSDFECSDIFLPHGGGSMENKDKTIDISDIRKNIKVDIEDKDTKMNKDVNKNNQTVQNNKDANREIKKDVNKNNPTIQENKDIKSNNLEGQNNKAMNKDIKSNNPVTQDNKAMNKDINTEVKSINSTEMDSFVKKMHYPVKKQDIIDIARKERSDDKITNLLRLIPDKNYLTADELTREIAIFT